MYELCSKLSGACVCNDACSKPKCISVFAHRSFHDEALVMMSAKAACISPPNPKPQTRNPKPGLPKSQLKPELQTQQRLSKTLISTQLETYPESHLTPLST